MTHKPSTLVLATVAMMTALALGILGTWALSTTGLAANGARVFTMGEPAKATPVPKGLALIQKSDCLSCHSIYHKVVGPAFVAIAQRYAGKKGIIPRLVAKVKNGGSGNWGDVAMTPHPNLSNADITTMVRWILSLKPQKTTPQNTKSKMYSYKDSHGKLVKLDFQVYVKPGVVTKAIFYGFEQFDSYCFRCHGTDAVGGIYAPDLRVSLQKGMTRDQFISAALAGRPDKGMPSWAGFFDAKEMEDIYEYVKARSVDVLPAGNPTGPGS